MKTNELFKSKQVISLEIFPPRPTTPIETLYETVSELSSLQPDFISVTYGAGGTGTGVRTQEIAAKIKHQYGIESVAHLAGLYLAKTEAAEQLDRFKEAGIENILALRGDVHAEQAPKADFRYASDLVSFIREYGDFNIIGACYPEGHRECADPTADIRNLKTKVDAGVSQLVTQLFFSNADFYAFRERAHATGIHVPIEAGIMPVVNKQQIERMTSLCGVKLPQKFLAIMQRYEHNPIAMRDAGIAYAIDQIVDLITQGVDGIHLYTMNNPYIARRIYEAVISLLAA